MTILVEGFGHRVGVGTVNLTAPSSDPDERNYRIRLLPQVMTPWWRNTCHLTYLLQRTVRAAPALRPERVLLVPVPLGQSPSLRLLRRRLMAGFVRRLLRYYGTVRLPMSVHHRRMS